MGSTPGRWAAALSLAFLSALAPLEGAAQESGDLLVAAMHDDLARVRALLAAGADIDQQNEYGHTPLIIAANYGYEELAAFLVGEGADVDVQGRDGATALLAAASNSQPLVELLLSHGADVDARLANGSGVFTQVAVGILSGRVTLDLAGLLLSKGARVDDSTTSGPTRGYTPLMMAARNDDEALVRFLIENGANVNAEAGDGATALSLATDEGHETIVDLLRQAGGR